MHTLPVEERTACEVFAGGEWWPGRVDTWDHREDGWWAFCWVWVTEWQDVPRIGLTVVPLTYLRWVHEGNVRPRPAPPTPSVE